MPKGTLVIRAAEQLGIEIPRFCDHPLLDPAGACRQCIVEVEGQRKPMASCTITCTDGMVVKTQLTSPVAEKAQRGVMELLLINHPLDCPVCDKGGECPLQNQAMSHGHADSRFEGKKRTFEKPVPISTQVLLDRERCVLCARCTRFSNQIAGDPMIELLERGALQQVGTGEGDPFESYFSGNTIQICPVGALTSAAYRFRSRPFDLVSSPSRVRALLGRLRDPYRPPARQGHAAARRPTTPRSTRSGSATRAASASATRSAATGSPRPLVRGEDGELEPASWPEALEAAAAGAASAARGRAGVLTGGRLTVEDAYAYAKFARVALDTNDIDFRARVHSGEEADFLAARVAGRGRDLDGTGVTYTALEKAPAVLLAGFEAEEEAPGVFLRLRKAMRKHGQRTFSLATHATRGLEKAGGTLLPAAPGTETEWLDALAGGVGLDERRGDGRRGAARRGRGDRRRRAAGRRARRADRRRTGRRRDRRPAGVDPAPGRGARRRRGGCAAVAAARAAARPPTRAPATRSPRSGASPNCRSATAGTPARSSRPPPTASWPRWSSAASRSRTCPTRRAPRRRWTRSGFLVSLELRPSEVTDRADVVLPVAAVVEKAGTFLNWEGRARPFEASLKPDQMTRRHVQPDARVLHMLADALDVHLGLPDVRTVRARAGPARPAGTGAAGHRARLEHGRASCRARPPGEAVLAGHRLLLDQGRLQEGDEALAGTRHAGRRPRCRPPRPPRRASRTATCSRSPAPPESSNCRCRSREMPDRVVWLPLNSAGGGVAGGHGRAPR